MCHHPEIAKVDLINLVAMGNSGPQLRAIICVHGVN